MLSLKTYKKNLKKNSQSSLDLATNEQLQTLVNEKSIFDKIIFQLDTWEKDIDKFGKETLGVAIQLVVAKETIKAMKLAAKTAKAANEIIKAGIEHLKTTDWYKNLEKADQKKINLRSLKNLVAESIREVNKLESSLEKTEQKLSDIRQNLAEKKATRKEVIASITDFLKNNKVNKNITPTEVNRLITEASRILTKADPLKAFDQFVDSYNKIISKGEQREANKLRDKTEPNRTKVIRNVAKQISQGKSKEEIINSLKEKIVCF